MNQLQLATLLGTLFCQFVFLICDMLNQFNIHTSVLVSDRYIFIYLKSHNFCITILYDTVFIRILEIKKEVHTLQSHAAIAFVKGSKVYIAHRKYEPVV